MTDSTASETRSQVVSLARNHLVSFLRNQVVSLARNQVVNITGISTHTKYPVTIRRKSLVRHFWN